MPAGVGYNKNSLSARRMSKSPMRPKIRRKAVARIKAARFMGMRNRRLNGN